MYNYLDVFFKLRRESNDTLMKCLSEEMEGLRVIIALLRNCLLKDVVAQKLIKDKQSTSKQLVEDVDKMLNIAVRGQRVLIWMLKNSIHWLRL